MKKELLLKFHSPPNSFLYIIFSDWTGLVNVCICWLGIVRLLYSSSILLLEGLGWALYLMYSHRPNGVSCIVTTKYA